MILIETKKKAWKVQDSVVIYPYGIEFSEHIKFNKHANEEEFKRLLDVFRSPAVHIMIDKKTTFYGFDSNGILQIMYVLKE